MPSELPQEPLFNSHTPVLLTEIKQAFLPALGRARFRDLEAPEKVDENFSLRYFDGTTGRGGHLAALLEMAPMMEAICYDRDDAAIQYLSEKFAASISDGKVILKKLNFMTDFETENEGKFDFVLLDLGVSSPQLDEPGRGFSFYHEGPLDMRMDRAQKFSAADILAESSDDELMELFKDYGEIKNPFRVVRAIVHDRKTTPFTTTTQLSGLIERVDGWKKKGHHPATNYFLALRLKVNEELDNLETGLRRVFSSLKPGGRLAVISFHSLEDRITKYIFRELAEDENNAILVNRKVIIATDEEIEKNPRSRSAKLRVIEKPPRLLLENPNQT